MDYSKVINTIELQDKRNIINRINREISDIPNQLQYFFNKYDPVDVEIVLKDLSAIKLYSYENLGELQEQYNLGEEYFIFATKNSDPIALFEHKVIIIIHGREEIETEILAESFDSYIDKLIENIK